MPAVSLVERSSDRTHDTNSLTSICYLSFFAVCFLDRPICVAICRIRVTGSGVHAPDAMILSRFRAKILTRSQCGTSMGSWTNPAWDGQGSGSSCGDLHAMHGGVGRSRRERRERRRNLKSWGGQRQKRQLPRFQSPIGAPFQSLSSLLGREPSPVWQSIRGQPARQERGDSSQTDRQPDGSRHNRRDGCTAKGPTKRAASRKRLQSPRRTASFAVHLAWR